MIEKTNNYQQPLPGNKSFFSTDEIDGLVLLSDPNQINIHSVFHSIASMLQLCVPSGYSITKDEMRVGIMGQCVPIFFRQQNRGTTGNIELHFKVHKGNKASWVKRILTNKVNCCLDRQGTGHITTDCYSNRHTTSCPPTSSVPCN